jgi:hypothetical protein
MPMWNRSAGQHSDRAPPRSLDARAWSSRRLRKAPVGSPPLWPDLQQSAARRSDCRNARARRRESPLLLLEQGSIELGQLRQKCCFARPSGSPPEGPRRARFGREAQLRLGVRNAPALAWGSGSRVLLAPARWQSGCSLKAKQERRAVTSTLSRLVPSSSTDWAERHFRFRARRRRRLQVRIARSKSRRSERLPLRNRRAQARLPSVSAHGTLVVQRDCRD